MWLQVKGQKKNCDNDERTIIKKENLFFLNLQDKSNWNLSFCFTGTAIKFSYLKYLRSCILLLLASRSACITIFKWISNSRELMFYYFYSTDKSASRRSGGCCTTMGERTLISLSWPILIQPKNFINLINRP